MLRCSWIYTGLMFKRKAIFSRAMSFGCRCFLATMAWKVSSGDWGDAEMSFYTMIYCSTIDNPSCRCALQNCSWLLVVGKWLPTFGYYTPTEFHITYSTVLVLIIWLILEYIMDIWLISASLLLAFPSPRFGVFTPCAAGQICYFWPGGTLKWTYKYYIDWDVSILKTD